LRRFTGARWRSDDVWAGTSLRFVAAENGSSARVLIDDGGGLPGGPAVGDLFAA
jgi:hypothetical protein